MNPFDDTGRVGVFPVDGGREGDWEAYLFQEERSCYGGRIELDDRAGVIGERDVFRNGAVLGGDGYGDFFGWVVVVRDAEGEFGAFRRVFQEIIPIALGQSRSAAIVGIE